MIGIKEIGISIYLWYNRRVRKLSFPVGTLFGGNLTRFQTWIAYTHQWQNVGKRLIGECSRFLKLEIRGTVDEKLFTVNYPKPFYTRVSPILVQNRQFTKAYIVFQHGQLILYISAKSPTWKQRLFRWFQSAPEIISYIFSRFQTFN